MRLTMIKKIKDFNWLRLLLPFSTYYKLKNGGIIHPMLVFLDLIILCIPFSAVIVVLLVNTFLKDVKEDDN